MTRRVPLDENADVVRRWRNQRRSLSRAKAALASTEAELLAALGDAEEGTLGGEPAVRRDVDTRPRIDVDRFREEFPDLYEQFKTQQKRTWLKLPRRKGNR